MDPVTHIAAGVLIGEAARDRFPAGRALIPLAAFAAWMPDLDNIVTFFGPEAYMRYHRGYTHSLLGVTLMAWLLAAVAHRFWKSVGVGKFFLLFFLCALSHIFLDCITSYGTGVLLPFSDARLAVPSVFIVDPFFTGVLVILAVLGLIRTGARKAFAASGLAVMLLWPALGFGVSRIVASRAASLLAASGEKVETVHVQPDALAPVWWKVIAEQDDGYLLTGLDLLNPDTLLPIRRYQKAGRAELEALGREAPVFSEYVWFTDFPVKSAAASPKGATVTFQDLRFMAVNPLVTKVRGTMVPFTLTAYLDPAGRLIRAVFSQVGKGEMILPRNAEAAAGRDG